jgi:hypothetical protein
MPKNDDFKMSEKQHNAYILKKKLMDIDAGDDKDIAMSTSESIVDAEADNECNSESDTLSDSDFEIEHEINLKKWTSKRNMAMGIQMNNSFTGPYPEDQVGLHVDRGMNYQF